MDYPWEVEDESWRGTMHPEVWDGEMEEDLGFVPEDEPGWPIENVGPEFDLYRRDGLPPDKEDE